MGRQINKTPLERILGSDVAEEAYDRLTMTEQIIVDLVVEGWHQKDIADVLSISQPTVSVSIRRISYKLADSKLKKMLEVRQQYRDNQNSNTAF